MAPVSIMNTNSANEVASHATSMSNRYGQVQEKSFAALKTPKTPKAAPSMKTPNFANDNTHSHGLLDRVLSESAHAADDCSSGKLLQAPGYETPSTASGDELSFLPSADETSSDSEVSDSAQADAGECLIYPITMLLALRASVLRSGASSHVKYSTRPRADFEISKEVAPVQKRPTPKANQANRTALPAASANSWTAQQRNSQDEDEKVTRAARSILNKLTIEKFDGLFEQLATCGVRTPDHIAMLMREVFEKATQQHHFIGMYADLCVRMEADPRLAEARGAEGEPNSFRRLLLNQCQTSFEQLLEPQPQDVADDIDAEQESEAARRKRQAIGNIKLVGELIVRRMLSSRLLVQCGDALIHSREATSEALECLAALLTVAAPKFDDPEWPHFDRLLQIFVSMEELTKNKKVPARTRFLLCDVLDLRRKRWPDPSQMATKREGPMRLEEVRDRAAGENNRTPQAARAKNAALDKLENVMKTVAPKEKERISNSNSQHEHACLGPRQKKPIKKVSARTAACQGQLAQENVAPQVAASVAKPFNEQAANRIKESPVKIASPMSDANNGEKSRLRPEKSAATPEQLQSTQELSSNSAVGRTPASLGEQPLAAKVATPELVPTPDAACKVNQEMAPPTPFDPAAFHRELSATLRELSSDRNVAAAVRRIRAQAVPKEYQAKEFTDLLTRAAEERRGPARRSSFAFAAGLAAAEHSAFGRNECMDGIKVFFDEVFSDLCLEVPRLPAIITAELLPTLKSVLPLADLNLIVPPELRSA